MSKLIEGLTIRQLVAQEMDLLLGYQIENADGSHRLPPGFDPMQIFTEQEADEWLAVNGGDDWIKVAIYEGDLENAAEC
jgi:hypothetical protein